MRTWVFVAFLGCSCALAPHLREENVAKNQQFLASLSAKEIGQILLDAAMELRKEQPDPAKIEALVWVLSGEAGAGTRVVSLVDGLDGKAVFSTGDGILYIGLGIPSSCRARRTVGLSIGEISLWTPEEEAAISWLRLRQLAHEVAHATDMRLPRTPLGGGLRSVWEGLFGGKRALKIACLQELWAEYFSAHILVGLAERVGTQSPRPWLQAIQYPGAFHAWPEDWMLFSLYQLSGGAGTGYDLSKAKTLEEIFEICYQDAELRTSLPYVLSACVVVITEAEEGFESPELPQFLKTCSWGDLSKRVDRILGKRPLKGCIEKFQESRRSLLKRLGG